jgi:hypothetical protein
MFDTSSRETAINLILESLSRSEKLPFISSYFLAPTGKWLSFHYLSDLLIQRSDALSSHFAHHVFALDLILAIC